MAATAKKCARIWPGRGSRKIDSKSGLALPWVKSRPALTNIRNTDPMKAAVVRYSLCVLVSSIGWCGFLADIPHYGWFLRGHLSDSADSRDVPDFPRGFWV